MEKSLAEFVPDETGVLARISDRFIESRLNAMGIIPNSKLSLVRKSPFGHTFYIQVDSSFMAIRKDEAAVIYLEVKK